jgi:hypothetical protein
MILAAIPILIELFTSEGCSSCPPADELLRKLRTGQPVDGVELITLSEHVDYWDYIGWKDPNASPEFTRRQHGYARERGAYTPQMVVDGQWELVGSDARALARAIERAARVRKTPVRLSISGRKLAIDLEAPPPGSDAMLAVVEHGVASAVSRGENQGRRLQHDSVVRRLRDLGEAKGHLEIALPDGQADAVVVFLQDRASRHVTGVAQLSLR